MISIGLSRTAVYIILGLAMMDVACTKRPRLATIPPPAPQTVQQIDPTATVPAPPEPQSTPPVAGNQQIQPPVMEVPVPPKDDTKSKHRSTNGSNNTRRQTSTTPTESSVPPPPSTPPVEPAPFLGQMLSPEQQHNYSQDIDRDLGSARENLRKAVASNALSDAQKALVSQVESFIRQTEQLRKSDLVEAKGLAHKADVLARDLAASVQ